MPTRCSCAAARPFTGAAPAWPRHGSCWNRRWRAIRLSPRPGRCWRGTYYVLPDYLDMRPDEAFALAERAALRARELDPGIGLAWGVLAHVAEHRGEWIEAVRLQEEGIARDPADPTGYLWRGIRRVPDGRFRRGRTRSGRGAAHRPALGRRRRAGTASASDCRGDRARGDAVLQRSAELGWGPLDLMRMRFALADGDRERAALHLRLNYQRYDNITPASQAVIDAAAAAIGDPARMGELLAAVDGDAEGINHFGWGALLGVLGAHRRALEIELDPGRPRSRNFLRQIWWPTARGMAEDPLLLRVAERDGLLAYWRAQGFPAGCRLLEQPEPRMDCSERWRTTRAGGG